MTKVFENENELYDGKLEDYEVIMLLEDLERWGAGQRTALEGFENHPAFELMGNEAFHVALLFNAIQGDVGIHPQYFAELAWALSQAEQVERDGKTVLYWPHIPYI